MKARRRYLVAKHNVADQSAGPAFAADDFLELRDAILQLYMHSFDRVSSWNLRATKMRVCDCRAATRAIAEGGGLGIQSKAS